MEEPVEEKRWAARLRSALQREMESTIGTLTEQDALRVGCQVIAGVFEDWGGRLDQLSDEAERSKPLG